MTESFWKSDTKSFTHDREGNPVIQKSIEDIKYKNRKSIASLKKEIDARNQEKDWKTAYLNITNQTSPSTDWKTMGKLPEIQTSYTIDPSRYEKKFPDVEELLAVNRWIEKELSDQTWWIEFSQVWKHSDKIVSLLQAFIFVQNFSTKYPELFRAVEAGSTWRSFDGLGLGSVAQLNKQYAFLELVRYVFNGSIDTSLGKTFADTSPWHTMKELFDLPPSHPLWKAAMDLAQDSWKHHTENDITLDTGGNVKVTPSKYAWEE